MDDELISHDIQRLALLRLLDRALRWLGQDSPANRIINRVLLYGGVIVAGMGINALSPPWRVFETIGALSVAAIGAAVSFLSIAANSRGSGQSWVRERQIATRTAETLAGEIGIPRELVNTTSPPPAVTFIPSFEFSPHGRGIRRERAAVQTEVDRRVDVARRELLDLQKVLADTLSDRVRAIEESLPANEDFQKYATAEGLFLAYQVGELTKRLDRIESRQLGRFEVVGYAVTTVVAAVAVGAGLVDLLKSAGVLK